MFRVYCDGASSGNPGPAGCAIVTEDQTYVQSAHFDYATNNEAEYAGFIMALKYIKTIKSHPKIDRIELCCDSQLVVGQTLRNWACNGKNLMNLVKEAKELIAELGAKELPATRSVKVCGQEVLALDPNCKVWVKHIPGKENLADRYAKAASKQGGQLF
jgi:ribonuclease HI